MAVRYLLALCTMPALLYMLGLFARDPTTLDPGSILLSPFLSTSNGMAMQTSIVLALFAQVLPHKHAGACALTLLSARNPR